MSDATDRITASVCAAAPVYDKDGKPVDKSLNLAFVVPAIDSALRNGATEADVTSWLVGKIAVSPDAQGSYERGWNAATVQNHSLDTELVTAFRKGAKPPSGRTAEEIKADALNGANVYEAQAGHGFAGLDGKNHFPGEQGYDEARAALYAAPPANPTAGWNGAERRTGSPDRRTGKPTGGPGIG